MEYKASSLKSTITKQTSTSCQLLFQLDKVLLIGHDDLVSLDSKRSLAMLKMDRKENIKGAS
jgi:hypothetical protein